MPRRRTGRPPGRPIGSVATGETDLQLFEVLHRGQAVLHRKRQRLQQEMLKLDLDSPEWTALEGKLKKLDRLGIEKTDTFLQRTSTAIVNIKTATRESLETVPTEQLEAQLRAEFVAAIRQWTAEQWAIVDEFRKSRAA